MSRAWVQAAVRKIEADFNRSADTHLFPLELPALPGIELYLKDESTHPTGSLKHRLARSLFLYGGVSRNPRKFRHPNSSPTTSPEKSWLCLPNPQR